MGGGPNNPILAKDEYNEVLNKHECHEAVVGSISSLSLTHISSLSFVHSDSKAQSRCFGWLLSFRDHSVLDLMLSPSRRNQAAPVFKRMMLSWLMMATMTNMVYSMLKIRMEKWMRPLRRRWRASCWGSWRPWESNLCWSKHLEFLIFLLRGTTRNYSLCLKTFILCDD